MTFQRSLWLSLLTALFGAASPCGCRVKSAFRKPDPGLNRMLEVPRYDVYEESRFFADGMTMRVPPEGTRPYGTETQDRLYSSGERSGRFLSSFPLELSEALLERGRDRYAVVCAACHGISGYGNDAVTRHMQRPAPSLHSPRIRELPPGKVFFVISRGYGFMPDFAAALSAQDRWAVVAYLKALERSQYAEVAALPADIRSELERRLP